MKKILVLIVTIVSILVGAGSVFALPLATGTYGGHQYAVVSFTGAWDEAGIDVATTLGAGWTLAAITSQGEQEAIVSLITPILPNIAGDPRLFWVGGYQETNSISGSGAERALSAWNWVTGENFSLYSNWADGTYTEPNDWGSVGQYSGEENFLALDFRSSPLRTGQWNDGDGATLGQVKGYVAETSAPVPEPATMLLLGSGLVGLAGFGRKKLFKRA